MKIDTFKGINNKRPTDRLGVSDEAAFVRDAANVDLSAVGTFQRRPGYDLVLAASSGRGLFAPKSGAYAYFASGDQLMHFDGVAAAPIKTLASAVSDLAYTETPTGVVASDGFSMSLLQDLQVKPLAPAGVNPRPLATASTGGALPAGAYMVTTAHVDAQGQRSQFDLPQSVIVPANGRITLTRAASPQRLVVFVTAPDGEVFYNAGTMLPNEVVLDVVVLTTSGEPMAYNVMALLPAGEVLAYHKGRLYSAVGNIVFYSLPYNLGLYRPAQDFIPLDADVTMLAAVEGGLYIGTAKAIHFMASSTPEQATFPRVAGYGAVRGTLATIPDSTDVMFFTDQGPVRAGSGGELRALQEREIAFPQAGSGAAFVRESNGLTQFVAALANPAPSAAAVMGSYMDAEVITQGAAP